MELLVYEHIHGLPDYLDSVDEELTEWINESCTTIKQAENEVGKINRMQPEDKYGRTRNLYIREE